MQISRDPEDLHPKLRERWEWLVDVWKEQYPNKPVPKLSCTYRDKTAQIRVYTSGKSNANWKESLHNYKPAYALDFYFQEDGKSLWDFELYEEFGRNAERLGLVWGGDWESKDGTHIQLPMTYVDAKNGNIPRMKPIEGTWYALQIKVVKTLQKIVDYYRNLT